MMFAIVFTIVFLALITPLLVMYFRIRHHFGGKVTPALEQRYAQSKQWDGKKFINRSKTTMDVSLGKMPRILKEQFSNRKPRRPEANLPILPFDEEAYQSNPGMPKFVWYGHSVLLLQINGKTLLIDPMLGDDTTPIAPSSSRRFSKDALKVIDQLPPLDAILITHDHYDHLDWDSINLLKDKTDTFLVGMGVGRHLEKWGVPESKITEFDWWDDLMFEEINITFTPSRHFSGRGLTDRAKGLWGGWVFKAEAHTIYWSGDGGYDEHFEEVGKRFGPFDWTFVECGQYNKYWHQIHLYPEEAAQAAEEAQSRLTIPVHWGAFTLAMHPWKESVERLSVEARKRGVSLCMPRLGEVVTMGREPQGEAWWSNVK